jgi:hypothetical protein
VKHQQMARLQFRVRTRDLSPLVPESMVHLLRAKKRTSRKRARDCYLPSLLDLGSLPYQLIRH